MAQPLDEQRIGGDESVGYRVACPECHKLWTSNNPGHDSQSVRALCDLCWLKRAEKSEVYLLAGPDRHHYVCRCGWKTWSRATPMSVRVFGLSCFHCRKRWRQSHHCPACQRKSKT